MINSKGTALVVSAHSADFVWRAGGAIALYAERGWDVTVVCLSFGERGESAKLWREPGMSQETVKSNRKEEATRAAEILGARVIFFDVGDYSMRIPDTILYQLAALYRKIRLSLSSPTRLKILTISIIPWFVTRPRRRALLRRRMGMNPARL